MPGDDVVTGAARVGTRSITIAASAGTVFNFLTQMGFGRAGWYSYDLIDNLGRRSATTLNQEWMVTEAGQTIPAGPLDFTVAVLDRPRALVIESGGAAGRGQRVHFTLSYLLENTGLVENKGPEDNEMLTDAVTGVRLVSRARMSVSGPLGSGLTPLLLLGDGVMVRRQLMGVKARSEFHDGLAE